MFGLGALAVVAVIAGTALSLWRMHEDVIQRAEFFLDKSSEFPRVREIVQRWADHGDGAALGQ